MARIGRETTIQGRIVAAEDLEILGAVEGHVRGAEHRVTIGPEARVKADVEADVVVVLGRVMGSVVARDLVEVVAGGVIGGDVRAPRVVLHDGAVVVGALDMSIALSRARVAAATPTTIVTGTLM